MKSADAESLHQIDTRSEAWRKLANTRFGFGDGPLSSSQPEQPPQVPEVLEQMEVTEEEDSSDWSEDTEYADEELVTDSENQSEYSDDEVDGPPWNYHEVDPDYDTESSDNVSITATNGYHLQYISTM